MLSVRINPLSTNNEKNKRTEKIFNDLKHIT